MLITKLNSKTQSYESGYSTGSAVSQSDVAAATKGLDKLSEALLYGVVLRQNDNYLRWIRDQIENDLAEAGLEHGNVVKIAPIMLEDLLIGHRQRYDKDMASGYSDDKIALKLNVSRRTYGRHWREKYRKVITRYEFIISHLNKMVSKQLG